jgi:hypothetical protein
MEEEIEFWCHFDACVSVLCCELVDGFVTNIIRFTLVPLVKTSIGIVRSLKLSVAELQQHKDIRSIVRTSCRLAGYASLLGVGQRMEGRNDVTRDGVSRGLL